MGDILDSSTWSGRILLDDWVSGGGGDRAVVSRPRVRFHQGYICMATSRHLVHSSIVDEYVERLAARA